MIELDLMRERDLWRSQKDPFGRECLFVAVILSILVFAALILRGGGR